MKVVSFIKKNMFSIVALWIGLLAGYVLFSSNEGTGGVEQNQEDAKIEMYTCSMHPHIKQSKKGTCPLCGMDLITINMEDNSLNDYQFKMTDRAMALANVETSTVGIKKVGLNKLALSGEISTNERTNAIQTTIFDGRLDVLNVKTVGQYVKKGEQIGTMYSPEMYLAQDKLLTSASYRDTHQKLFAAARNTLGLWKMNDDQIDELLQSGKPLMNFPLYADVSGTVTEVIASEGGYFKEGDALYKVSHLSKVWAVFDAYENELPFLSVGQDITISSSALKGVSIKAKISYIEPILNLSKRIVSVRVTLNNKDSELKPGMFVEGVVSIQNKEAFLMIPKSAVLWTGERSIVYKKAFQDNSVFELVTVRLGERIGDNYVVLDGLTPGDEIVTKGTFTIDASAQLQGKKSMLSSKMTLNTPRELISDQSRMINNPKLKEKISDMLSSYFGLKNELVNSEPEKVQEIAKKMNAKYNNLELGLVDKEIRNKLLSIKNKLELISNTDNLLSQRKEFKFLSEKMIFIANTFKTLNQPVYIQHCPMADDNKGADWLSLEKSIKNPYFGDKMLSCGSIKEVLE